MRIKCINAFKEGLKDPDITEGKFYNVIDPNVFVMGQELMYSFVGDNDVEVSRPKQNFRIMFSRRRS